jgi:hypothetical protein
MPLIALFVGVSILLMKEKGVFRKEIKMTREEAIDIAISALRPVSREQVERVWHGRWIKHEGYDECSECHAKSIFGYNYCHNCGASMTDEAVEMVLERMEALNG